MAAAKYGLISAHGRRAFWRSLGICSYLKSEAGCIAQHWHQDFIVPPDVSVKPGGLSISLMDDDGSSLLFKGVPFAGEERLRLHHAGDAIYFEGDVFHAGDSYERDNWRLHAYIVTPECPTPANSVYNIVER